MLDGLSEREGATLDFSTVFEATPTPCLVLDSLLRIVGVNSAYLAATMTKRADLLGRHIFEAFPDNPEDGSADGVSNLRTSLELVLKHRRPHAMAEQRYDIRRPPEAGGGFEERYWSPTNIPCLGPNGEVAHILHTVRDVTEYVRLRESNREQSQVARRLAAQTSSLERALFDRSQEALAACRELEELRDQLETRVRDRTVELETSNTELRDTRAQLLQSQKLEIIGHLAGGIAHDFNNVLSVILSYTQLSEWSLEDPEALEEHLTEIRSAAQRAADLTRQLLAFSRKQVLDFRTLNLNEVVRNLSKMLERVLGEDVELNLELAPNLENVSVDPGQMDQVLLNLAVNARDAMKRGGTLTISTTNSRLDGSVHPDAHGDFVELGVRDTGTGMDPEVQRRIFEPFFTTKPVGQGTGLGLSTVFGIVKQSRGFLQVQSKLGVGTSFKLYLPRATGPVTWTRIPTPLSQDLRGQETIVLVEDDPQVRVVATSILERLGYRVLARSSPFEALEANDEGAPIDLLMTDVVLPQMNGREFARRFAERRGRVRTIFVSGYSDNIIADQSRLEDGDGFLQKPFTPESLSRKVREVLDASRH